MSTVKPCGPETLPLVATRKGKPRLDRQAKLMARLYEVLFLIRCLGQTRGPRTFCAAPAFPEQDKRRSFFKSVALICDYKRGGETCTAFGIAERDGGYVFALSAKLSRRCSEVLRYALETLRTYVNVKDDETRRSIGRRFVEECIRLSAPRISKYKKELRASTEECVRRLEVQKGQASTNDGGFLRWLKFNLTVLNGRPSDFDICLHMQNGIKSNFIHELAWLRRREQQQCIRAGSRGCYEQALHSIGRLARRLSGPCLLLREAPNMESILDSWTIEIVPVPKCAPLPPPDGHSTLPGIMSRIMGTNSRETEKATNLLIQMNDESGDARFRNFMSYYKSEPRVHAEICVLEYFQSKGYIFMDGDNFIYCSKPACFCCKWYIKRHSAHLVTPDSHEKVYTKWGAPIMPNLNDRDNETARKQLNLINDVTEALRQELLGQIWKRQSPAAFHEDTTTGIGSSGVQEEILLDAERMGWLDDDAASSLGLSSAHKVGSTADSDDAGEDSDEGGGALL